MEIYTLVALYSFVICLRQSYSQRVPDPSLRGGCRASRGQFAHETYCHQYYNCWDGGATIEQCPGDLLFNNIKLACDYPESVNCGGRIRNPAPFVAGGRCLKEWGTFPDTQDCSAFYECAHGRAFHKYCPLYTAFDDRYLVCAHAHEVQCGGRGGVYGALPYPPGYPLDPHSDRASAGRARDMEKGVGGGGGGSGIGGGGSGVDREKQFEKTISPESTFRCPHPRGLFVHAIDCTKFWLCREYRPSLLKCPTDLLFDLNTLTCRRPELAECSTLTPRT